MPLASSPPPIRDKKLNQQTIAMARVFQQTARTNYSQRRNPKREYCVLFEKA
jgi:hypothetical protein